jgi:formate hydrogenlyase subunit 5
VLRLVSGLCGSRFGRGVVVPGGITAFPFRCPEQVLAEIGPIEKQVAADAESLMGTSSFLDRLRGTGPLTPVRAREHGALGPVGKASGYADDVRVGRPYDAPQGEVLYDLTVEDGRIARCEPRSASFTTWC